MRPLSQYSYSQKVRGFWGHGYEHLFARTPVRFCPPKRRTPVPRTYVLWISLWITLLISAYGCGRSPDFIHTPVDNPFSPYFIPNPVDKPVDNYLNKPVDNPYLSTYLLINLCITFLYFDSAIPIQKIDITKR